MNRIHTFIRSLENRQCFVGLVEHYVAEGDHYIGLRWGFHKHVELEGVIQAELILADLEVKIGSSKVQVSAFNGLQLFY